MPRPNRRAVRYNLGDGSSLFLIRAPEHPCQRRADTAERGFADALRDVSGVFESRGAAVPVEVGFSTNGRPFQIAPGPLGGRLMNRTRMIGLKPTHDPDDARGTGYHELGHLLEEAHPDVAERVKAFAAYRLAGERPVDLSLVPGSGGLMKGEKGRKDNFDRADAHRELLPAIAALLQTVANQTFRVLLTCLGAHALEIVDAMHAAAMWAHRAVRPQHAFELGEGRSLIVEIGLIENRHDTNSPRF
jgi:hypothetical protein